MYARVCMRLGAALIAAAVTGPASAATLTSGTVTLEIRNFANHSQLGTAQLARDTFLAGKQVKSTETFEDLDAWNGSGGASNPITKVGRFEGFGDRGTGGSAVNDGLGAVVRTGGMCCGRLNTDLSGNNWLDSNDMTGIRWTVEGLGKFNTLAFLLSDVADVGGHFSMLVGTESFANLAGFGGKLANGNLVLVMITLSEAVESLTIDMFNHRTNDGFGIDGATVARVEVLPVPPAALLLGSGIALLGVLRRRNARSRT